MHHHHGLFIVTRKVRAGVEISRRKIPRGKLFFSSSIFLEAKCVSKSQRAVKMGARNDGCEKICKIAACLLILLVNWAKSASSLGADLGICESGPEILLTKTGPDSSATISLSPNLQSTVCKIRVRAPKTHAISVHFLEEDAEEEASTKPNPPCVMSIFLPQNPRVPVWKGDICSSSAMKEVDLLTGDFRILWSPPEKAASTRGRRLVLTAVGQGDVCKEPGQHTCMRIGWDPMLCVSDNLLCDGVPNCPRSSSSGDEDEKLCRKHFFAPISLEQLAVELFKKFKRPELVNSHTRWLEEEEGNSEGHKELEERLKQFGFRFPVASDEEAAGSSIDDWRNWADQNETAAEIDDSSGGSNRATSSKPVMAKRPRASDSISQVLSKYGPWGYLMLGMLICGTVLMFCGLWECCFRKPKTEIDQDASSRNPQNHPTTVLVINPQESPPNPPNYDELDLPPSYTTLFPDLSKRVSANNSSTSPGSSSAETDDAEESGGVVVDIEGAPESPETATN